MNTLLLTWTIAPNSWVSQIWYKSSSLDPQKRLKEYWLWFAGLIYILGNLILWLTSLYFVLQEVKLHLDLKFITINIFVLTLLIWGLYRVKMSFWWADIISMIGSGLIICSIIYLLNRKKIWHLYQEIMKLKN